MRANLDVQLQHFVLQKNYYHLDGIRTHLEDIHHIYFRCPSDEYLDVPRFLNVPVDKV